MSQEVGKIELLIKAHVLGNAVPSPSAIATGEGAASVFAQAGALEAPYDAEALCQLFEHVSSLRPNVDAYATNIDGFGHRFEPTVDLEGENAERLIKDIILLERVQAAEASGSADPWNQPEPTSDELSARKRRLLLQAMVEKARLETFFESCCREHSFVGLRKRTRQDREVTGNGFWEVLRNGEGRIARFVYVPSHTVRLLSLDAESVDVDEFVRTSPVAFTVESVPCRLRRFVQVEGTETVYFKSLGDKRTVSRRTGRVLGEDEELGDDDEEAHELFHFPIHSPSSPYGVPRWVGNLMSVLGSRSAEEVNYLYFESKSVPPMALLVSGGKLTESSVPRIERFIEENIKGKKNFHRILILEAEGAANASELARAKIEIVPLTQAQQQDALFQHYDERNIDKVGSSFRVPRLLRGDSRDLNRSTAEAALRFAEDQVFAPERDEFDDFMNRRVLPDLGIRLWRFRSQTPVTRDPERLSDMVTQLVRVGVLTPEEGRLLASDIFNRELAKISDDWTKRPITLTLAGVQTGVSDLWERNGDELTAQARKLIAFKAALEGEEGRMAEQRMRLVREYLRDERKEPERVAVPNDEFTKWFAPDEAA